MKLVLSLALLATLTACSTTKVTKADEPIKSPTPAVVKDQTVAAQGKVENTQTIDLPAWYIKAPASTEDYVYITGTGISSDLSMSRTKALLDAQVQLADKINGMINALTKQTRKDDSGQVRHCNYWIPLGRQQGNGRESRLPYLCVSTLPNG